MPLPDGELWFAQNNGLGHLDDGRFRVYSIDHGITGDALNAITPDANGSLWIGTDTNGASRLERERVHDVLDREPGAARLGHRDLGRSAGDAVRDRRPDRRDQLFREQPVRAGAIERSSVSGFGRAADPHGWRSRIIWAIGGFPRRRGCTGFLRLDDVRQLAHVRPRAVYTTRDGLTGDRVYYAFEDSRGDIWLGTNPSGQDVVTRWQRATGSFHRYSTADGLRTATDVYFAAARAFAEDAAGNVWIGFAGGGLARFASGVFTFFTAADGVAAGELRHLFVDSRGRLWIGSHTRGVSRADAPATARPQFRTYTVRDGLASDSVRSISEDRWGRIYLGNGPRRRPP